MDKNAVLSPLLAMVLLTFLSWLYMYWRRYRIMVTHKLDIEAFRPENEQLPQSALATGNNLGNLFELPVLFYVLSILLMITDRVDAIFVNTAWFFVLARALHTLIHSTYNRILHRFSVYLVGSFALWFMWGRFAWMILG